ncbi:unnamed protein product [Porites lobata]|uniref:Uncharacterized protein n=1 Tax=Porites lobata TaxID=104759 RepID=A0ABN8Q0A2_9CNID|nr:unnamed protein product [Porites lobata]
MEDPRLKKNELDTKFVIEEMYGKKGAYPSGEGATLVLGKVDITHTLTTQVPLGLESSASNLLQHCRCSSTPSTSPDSAEESSLEELFRNLSLQDSPCYSTPSSPVSTAEDPSYLCLQENDRHSHAEISFLRELEREVQRLEREGGKVEKINVELIQNYAPCHACADEMIEFKEKREKEENMVSIKLTFANYYFWIGYHHTNEFGKKNLNKLKYMHEKGIDLQLLQGKESWETLFDDSDLVDLNGEEKEELLNKATSDNRKKREEYDRYLRDKEKLFKSSCRR